MMDIKSKLLSHGSFGYVHEKNNSQVIKKTNFFNDSLDSICQQNLQEVVFYKLFSNKCKYICQYYDTYINNYSFELTLEKYPHDLDNIIERLGTRERMKLFN